MTVELSSSEIDLLDEALKAWEKQPISEGFGTAMLRAVVGPKESRRETMEAEIAEVEKDSKARERRALLLRAKLMQASARESEHTTPSGGAP